MGMRRKTMSWFSGMAVKNLFVGLYPIPERMYRFVINGVSGIECLVAGVWVVWFRYSFVRCKL